MRIQDYPAQEPFSDFALPYVAEVMRRGEGVQPTAEMSYGEDPYQAVAIHVPESPNGTVVAFVHGGGWTSGYKEHMNFMAPAFTAAGVIFCSIGYRLAPQHLFPIGFNDVADGLSWIHDNIAEYGGNPERLFAGGHSAGGHYTALLAVTAEWRRSRGMPDNVIRGCLPISGVYLFGEGSGLSVSPRFLGGEASGNESLASPLAFELAGAPPFLIAYGTEDFPHLKIQGAKLARSLAAADVGVETIILEGRDHLGASLAGGEADGPWLPATLQWLSNH
ncbi:MAG: alpha/beta hydrolase [Pseudomonadota bacterium]|nr:alpha/beta hydrolase [Pseudomonadota bacterium]